MHDFARIYAKQEYMTPGAATTVEMIAGAVQPDERTLLLDVGAGKGEAAATLAGRFACRVIAVEPYDQFVHIAASKMWFYNLRDLAYVVRADGGKLPVRDAAVDASYCIGGPSIVGLDRALPEMARVTKPGGHVIVSDAVWRAKPEAPLGSEWQWLAEAEQVSVEEYAARLASAGLEVERTHVHPQGEWEDYFAPMREVASEAKSGEGADPFFADELESTIALEERAVDEYLDYVTLVCRRV